MVTTGADPTPPPAPRGEATGAPTLPHGKGTRRAPLSDEEVSAARSLPSLLLIRAGDAGCPCGDSDGEGETACGPMSVARDMSKGGAPTRNVVTVGADPVCGEATATTPPPARRRDAVETILPLPRGAVTLEDRTTGRTPFAEGHSTPADTGPFPADVNTPGRGNIAGPGNNTGGGNIPTDACVRGWLFTVDDVNGVADALMREAPLPGDANTLDMARDRRDPRRPRVARPRMDTTTAADPADPGDDGRPGNAVA